MTTRHDDGPGPRRRALLIGLGLDDQGTPRRIINGEHCLIVGGTEEEHDELLETVLRLEAELERRDQRLGDVPPTELAEIAWRIDSPALHRLALRLHHGLRRRGLDFDEASPEQLTEICLGVDG